MPNGIVCRPSQQLQTYRQRLQRSSSLPITHLLSVADEAGYEIPEHLQDRMRNGLIGFVEGRATIRRGHGLRVCYTAAVGGG